MRTTIHSKTLFKMSSAFLSLGQDNKPYDSLINFLASNEIVLYPSGTSSTIGLESFHLEEDRMCLQSENGKCLLQRELFSFFEGKGKEGRISFCLRIAVAPCLWHLFLEPTTPCSCEKDKIPLIPFQKTSAEKEGIK